MAALTSLAGLSGLATSSDDFSLDVRDVPTLTELPTFGDRVGVVRLRDAPSLEDLGGFAATTRAGTLTLDGIAAADLTGLGSLVEVEVMLQIGDCAPDANDPLTTLAGLEQLERATTLALTGNGGLTDVTALVSLVEVDDLWVTDNPVLPSTQADALVAALPDADATICGNSEGSRCRECPPLPN